jgi:DNA-binding NarL/FixJ family response regulator
MQTHVMGGLTRMSNNEIIRELLERIYQTDNADDMKRLTGACIAILDAAEPKAKPKEKKAEPKQEKTKHKKVDAGKIKACYEAGWPIKLIADEIQASEATVRYHLKKEGLIK